MKDQLSSYLRPWLRLFLFVFLVVIVALPLLSVLQTSPIKEFLDGLKPENSAIINEFALFIVVLTALGVLVGVSKENSWLYMFYREGVMQSGFAMGTLIGSLLILVITGILMVLGCVQFQYTGLPYQNFVPLAVLFLAVALFEEFLFRSYVLGIFAERYPFVLIIVINGLLFACAHLGNDHYSILGFVNITLAGALLSLMIIQKWNIGWGVGLHFGWNTMQGGVLGYPVSGLGSKGTFVAKLKGPTYLSGGQFGIEGSLICTIIFTLLLLGLFYYFKIHPLAVVEEDKEDAIAQVED